MKIVFLDVDGVFNSERSFETIKRDGKPDVPESLRHLYHKIPLPWSYYFHAEAISALNHLVTETGARIVISSTWRDWSLIHLHEHFKWQGYTGKRFLSRTPGGGGHVASRWDKQNGYVSRQVGSIVIATRRGHEIDWWLRNIGGDRVRSFVILDDENDMAMHQARLVQTSSQIGLTMEHARRAAALLHDQAEQGKLA